MKLKIIATIVCCLLFMVVIFTITGGCNVEEANLTTEAVAHTTELDIKLETTHPPQHQTTEACETSGIEATFVVDASSTDDNTPEPELEVTSMATATPKPTSTPKPVNTYAYSAFNFTDEEVDMLLKIGMAEAGNQSVECIATVMLTVLNRVKSDKFPNNIHDVLYQKGQFSPVASGSFKRAKPSNKCTEAFNLILTGWDESQGCLYFESSSKSSTWHSRNLKFLFKIGKMRFYK